MLLNLKFPKRTTIVLYLISFFLISCSTDDDVVQGAIEEEVEVFNEFLTDAELEYITNLLIVDEELDEMWPHFKSLREVPIYIITEENQGIYINPSSTQLENSRAIYNDIGEFEKLNMYRNDTLLEFSKTNVVGIRFYNFVLYEDEWIYIYEMSEDIEAHNYFYNDYKNRNGLYHISVFFHELFHYYQGFQYGELWYDGNQVQDFNGYPLTEETLPLLLLLFDVMIDAHHAETYEEKLRLLKYYISIQHQLIEVDPTENNLIRNHGFVREKIEGSARYIEVFGTLTSINNNTIEDPTHGFKDFSDNISNRADMRWVYTYRMFYHTGAGAIHLLKELGYQNLDQAYLIPANKPYDIAKDFLNMTDVELEIFLQGAKTIYNWDALVERSEYLLSL